MHFSSFHGHMQDSGNTFTYLLLFGLPPRGLFFPKVGKHFCQRGQKISSWQKEGSQIVNVADIFDSFAHDNDDCPFNETSASKPRNFAICFEFRHKMILEEFMTFHLQPVFWDSTDSTDWWIPRNPADLEIESPLIFQATDTVDTAGIAFGGTFFWIFFRSA